MRIRPSENVTLNLHFRPEDSQPNLVPGDYDVRVFGFDTRGRLMFRSKPVRYPVTQDSLLGSFKGSQWVYYANLEQHIAEVLR